MLRQLLNGFRALLRKRSEESEMDEELRAYLETAIESRMRSGMSREQASRQARLAMGSLESVKQEIRDAGWETCIENISSDVRFGLRLLAKTPGFTLVAVLTLALGIGANTAMFSVIEAVVLRPLPFPETRQLVQVASVWDRGGVVTPYSCSPPDFFDWRDQNRTFSSMFAYDQGESALTGRGPAKRMRKLLATDGLFSTLKVHPVLGREFTREENREGAGHVALLSYGTWKSEYGGDSAVVGRTIELDSEPFTIIGVMPEEFGFPLRGSDLYLPIAFNDKVMTQRGAHYLRVLGRLKDGVGVEQANQDLGAIMAELRRLYPDKDGKWGVRADRLSSAMVADIRPALLLLMGAVGLVVLIACANTSNLLLARATVRQREMAMRSALGARRSRIVQQLLTEGLLLALLSGAVSLLVAYWALLAIVRFGPRDIPRLSTVTLSWPVLVFALLVSIATALFFALLPAFRASAADATSLLRMSASSSPAAGRARNLLLVSEVAISMLLLAGAGLLVRSFAGLKAVSPGFDPHGVVSFDVSVPDAHYKNSESLQSYWNEVFRVLRSVPGVTAAGAISPLPLSGDDFSSSFDIAGRSVPESEQPSTEVRIASPDYFRVMAIPVLDGRAFREEDRFGSERVVLASATAARMFFPAGDALGSKVRFGANGGYERNAGQIVGIVGDVRHNGIAAPIPPMFYVPLAQAGYDGATLVIRQQGASADLGRAARSAVQGIDKDALVGDPVPLATVVAGSLAQRQFYMLLLAAFAALALVLAMVGLYGVVSYSVAQRTSEMGIRVALGASRRDVFLLVMKKALALAGTGLVAGEALAVAFGRTLKSLLVGVSATDGFVLAITGLVLLLTTLLACYIPARRAMRVDPILALKYE